MELGRLAELRAIEITEIELVEKQDVIYEAKTVIVPLRVERPSLHFNFYKEPVRKGDIVECPILHNGTEVGRLSYTCSKEVERQEVRPHLHLEILSRAIENPINEFDAEIIK
jgi:hypothetical protein